MRDGFVRRKLKKWKQDWIGRCGFERTRWVVWGLRLEMINGVKWRGFEAELIRVLDIKLAVS